MGRPSARWLPVALSAVLLVSACSAPIVISGKGDVVSASGDRDCTYSDYVAAAASCTENLVIGEYDETYTAVPATGWYFHRWVNYCTEATDDTCSFDIPADVVSQAYGATAPPLIAIFRPDETPPVISNVNVAPAAQSATVTWNTNESASSEVDYGLTAALELGAVTDPALVTTHAINLAGLTAETTYSYEVTSTDGSNNTTTTAITTFTTPAPSTGPQVDLWYGDTINIGGAKAISQRFANVLGDVSDPSGIASFTASMNGGVEIAISHDPNFRRLLNPGDFNVDIAVSDLQSGSNTVVLTATSNAAATTTQSVTINYTPGAVGFAAQTIDWTGGTPDVVAQPIDGRWTAGAGGVRTADPGYDRLLGIGDVSWTDYEVTVPVTVNSFVAQPGPNSGDPAVGMLLRWNGHNTTLGTTQPLQGFVPDGVNPTPLGGYPLFRNNNFELRDHYALVQTQMYLPISLGVTYMMKARVQTLGDGSTVYSTKTWEAGQAEPAAYQLTFTAGTSDNQPPAGAIVLLAHEADVTFGNVTISPLS